MTLTRIFSLAAFLCAPFLCFGEEKNSEPFWKSSEFREMLGFAFVQELYWNPPPFYNNEFQPNESDPNSAWNVYRLPGRKISGVIKKSGKDYKVIFKDVSLPSLNNIFIHWDEKLGYRLTRFIPVGEDKLETVCENYEFTVPADFISLASKFGPGVEPQIENIKKVLENMLEDAPPGRSHFYAGPLRKYSDKTRIYWADKKIMITHELEPGKIFDLDSLVFWPPYNYALSEESGIELIGSCLRYRADFENTFIANCVRDGRLIVIEKKNTDNPEDKAWSTEEFRKALTYFLAHSQYWWIQPDCGAGGNAFESEPGDDVLKSYKCLGQKKKGKILKQKNVFSLVYCDDLQTSPWTVSLAHYKDGSWRDGDTRNFIPEKVVCEDYEFEIPADFIDIASKFDEESLREIEAIKRALEEWCITAGTYHLFIGPFQKYLIPSSESIYIYDLDDKLFYFPKYELGADGKARITDFKIESLDWREDGGGCWKDEVPEFKVIHDKSIVYKRCFSTNQEVSNCVRDGVMISFDKYSCDSPPLYRPDNEEEKNKK